MASWMWAMVTAVVMSAVLFSAGCVSPETAAKIDSLEQQIQDIAAKHAAGELSTKEATEAIAPLLEQMKAVRDAEEPWWEKAGYILLSILGVAVGRGLGIPGLRSSSGENVVSLLAAKKK